MSHDTTRYDGPIDYQMMICEHHAGGIEPTITPDPLLPLTWAIAECPACGYAAEVDTETGEVRPA